MSQATQPHTDTATVYHCDKCGIEMPEVEVWFGEFFGLRCEACRRQ